MSTRRRARRRPRARAPSIARGAARGAVRSSESCGAVAPLATAVCLYTQPLVLVAVDWSAYKRGCHCSAMLSHMKTCFALVGLLSSAELLVVAQHHRGDEDCIRALYHLWCAMKLLHESERAKLTCECLLAAAAVTIRTQLHAWTASSSTLHLLVLARQQTAQLTRNKSSAGGAGIARSASHRRRTLHTWTIGRRSFLSHR